MIKQQKIYSNNVLRGKKKENNNNDEELDNLKINNSNEKYEDKKEDLKNKDYNLFKKKYKSFFPSSNQLKQLELKQGQNEICFICRTTSIFESRPTLEFSIIFDLFPNSPENTACDCLK
jgi:hypothetical protein